MQICLSAVYHNLTVYQRLESVCVRVCVWVCMCVHTSAHSAGRAKRSTVSNWRGDAVSHLHNSSGQNGFGGGVKTTDVLLACDTRVVRKSPMAARVYAADPAQVVANEEQQEDRERGPSGTTGPGPQSTKSPQGSLKSQDPQWRSSTTTFNPLRSLLIKSRPQIQNGLCLSRTVTRLKSPQTEDPKWCDGIF